MTLALIMLFLTGGCEVLFLTSWVIRRWLTNSLSVILVAVTGLVLCASLNAITVTVALLMIYRIVNLERLTHRHFQRDYVKGPVIRASLVLITFQVLALAKLAVLNHYQFTSSDMLRSLALVNLLVAGLLAFTLRRQRQTTEAPLITTQRSERDLPSLTVAVPARNETADLEACLATLVKSTYLKLEILVLDDCSQNTRTPEIIRQFAHDGVRFIAGNPPPDNWLAKNYAYQQLVEEANGDLILFCGVDARFDPTALSSMVETMLTKRKNMLSVLPRNLVPFRFKLETLLVQPGRYAWELALPRRWLDRPPVLSTCWLIKRQTLDQAGGMAAVRRAILPERYFARFAATHDDGYSFLQSAERLGLASVKSFDDQRATAVRTRYPGLHRRIELTALLSLAELMLLVAPFGGLLYCLSTHQGTSAMLFALSCLLLTYMYTLLVEITYQQRLFRSLWLWPFAVMYDIGLLNYSMWQYEFGEVIWKGRNVCIPVMRVEPHLPRLDPPEYQQHYRKHSRHHHRHHSR